jgi:phospholipase D1/2
MRNIMEGAALDLSRIPSPEAPSASGDGAALLRTGETCWRLERADRLGVMIDAQDYFRTLKQALLGARHQVLLIAWDFDTRIRLEPDRDQPRPAGAPDKLGRFLAWLIRRKPGLQVHVLKWRFSGIWGLMRGMMPLWVLNLMSDRRLHYRVASDHPLGACHHQKIVVIDDRIAFCGGIDMTAERWDTRGHLDDDPRRRGPGPKHYEPYHDMTAAVDGDAARALGDLARLRWFHATGERLPAPPPPTPDEPEPWPSGLLPLLRHPMVGIARTQPAFTGQDEAHEVEKLWLEAIRSAKRYIYIEAQYFACRRIGKALLERLEQPDGPEIVIINPTIANGWLEEAAMGRARDHIMNALCATDPDGERFACYAPVTPKGVRIYVHAKLLIVDDKVLRIGSSNMNNRSMGVDTECDLAVALGDGPGDAEGRARLRDMRDGLIAEHLGISAPLATRTIVERGSMIAAIEALRRDGGKTLIPIACQEVNAAETFLVEQALLDPERPRYPFQSFFHRLDWGWARRRRARRLQRDERRQTSDVK